MNAAAALTRAAGGVAILLALTACVTAQLLYGSFAGVVLDMHEAAVPGARVVFTDAAPTNHAK